MVKVIETQHARLSHVEQTSPERRLFTEGTADRSFARAGEVFLPLVKKLWAEFVLQLSVLELEVFLGDAEQGVKPRTATRLETETAQGRAKRTIVMTSFWRSFNID